MSRALWVLLLLLACMPSRVQAREFDLDIGGAGLHVNNASGDVANQQRSLGFFLLRAGVEVQPRWQLEAQWQTGANTASVFAGTAAHRLSSDWLSVGARRVWPLTPWLRPFVRAGIGATHEAVELEGNGVSFQDSLWTPHVQGSVGLDLLLPTQVFSPRGPGSFTMGLSWELGYAHAFGRDVQARDDRALEPPLTRAPLDLGTLTLTGWVQRLAVTVHL
jgi:hypothetical protein